MKNELILNLENLDIKEGSKNFSIFIVGSDAREENPYKISPFEVGIISAPSYSEDAEKIATFLVQNTEIYPLIEVKILGSNLFYYNKTTYPHPSRVIDAYFLYGNKDIFGQMKLEFDALMRIGPLGRLIKSKERQRISFYKKKIIDNIINAENYSPTDIKSGPLRVMQSVVIHNLISLIRKDVLQSKDIPHKTLDRIELIKTFGQDIFNQELYEYYLNLYLEYKNKEIIIEEKPLFLEKLLTL